MHCRNCAKEIDDKAVVCIHCGVPPKSEKKFCDNCGAATEANQVVCVSCGVSLSSQSDKSKIVAGILAIFFGVFGVHKFYLGYMQQGFLCLFIFFAGLILAGIPSAILSIVVIIEGIIYLFKSDSEFQSTYVDNVKGWF